MEGQQAKVLIKLLLKNINKSDELYSLSSIEKEKDGKWLTTWGLGGIKRLVVLMRYEKRV